MGQFLNDEAQSVHEHKWAHGRITIETLFSMQILQSKSTWHRGRKKKQISYGKFWQLCNYEIYSHKHHKLKWYFKVQTSTDFVKKKKKITNSVWKFSFHLKNWKFKWNESGMWSPSNFEGLLPYSINFPMTTSTNHKNVPNNLYILILLFSKLSK